MKSIAMWMLLLALALPVSAQQKSEGRYDQQIRVKASEELGKRDKFKGVTATVEDGIVTLTGNVELYIDKVDAEKRVRKIQNADGVRNRIEVASSVHDEILRDQLSDKLRYDRIGYGIVFNNLTLSVENGVATVAGKVRDYPDRDSAIAIVETTPGVKDVIDEIEVAPTSINDDRLRIALARSIYGNSALQKYAIDPQAPIRIVVENGNVELHGVVTSKLDKQVAYTQASSVPGVFSVKNNIVVASEMNR
ncbi:MAG: BON domain-containing protein [Acidobacteriia bacterium]|jgi:hyperosmotically inducible protein|nr:BON domain-containing protein [Terriglobia bacterium]